MKSSHALLLATVTLAVGVTLGYTALSPTRKSTGQEAAKQPLYYRHPMNPQVTSDHPQKDEMGMDYVPVYAEPPIQAPAERQVLHYRNPMNPAVISPTPQKDSMGMDYLPVYADEAMDDTSVRITPEKIQKLGVRTETAAPRRLSRQLLAVGTVAIDERRQQVVTARVEGWITRLWVNTTGQPVRRGQALMEVYSPSVLSAEEEYLIAARGQEDLLLASPESQATAKQLTASALQRLRLWQIPEAELKRLQTEGKAAATITLTAPGAGLVMEKLAVEGMRFMPGEPLLRMADLSTVWLMADVFEQDLGAVRPGQTVKLSVDAYPGKVFNGRVAFVYPTLNPDTRTVKVRIELPNPQGLLKPAMFGNVELAETGQTARVAVPDAAVLDSGTRQIVIVRVGEAYFQPRTVQLGRRGDGYVEILNGVMAGENVVVGANFLIDAESNLRAALRGMDGSAATASQPMPANSVNDRNDPAMPPMGGHGGH